MSGKSELEACATGTTVRCDKAGVVRLNDAAADGEAHADALRLGGEEGFENVGGNVRREARATVFNGDTDMLRIFKRGSEGEIAWRG